MGQGVGQIVGGYGPTESLASYPEPRPHLHLHSHPRPQVGACRVQAAVCPDTVPYERCRRGRTSSASRSASTAPSTSTAAHASNAATRSSNRLSDVPDRSHPVQVIAEGILLFTIRVASASGCRINLVRTAAAHRRGTARGRRWPAPSALVPRHTRGHSALAHRRAGATGATAGMTKRGDRAWHQLSVSSAATSPSEVGHFDSAGAAQP